MRYLWHRLGGDEPARALVSRTLFTPLIASWGRDYSLLNRSLCKFGILSRDLQQSTQRGIISNQARRLGSCSIRWHLPILRFRSAMSA